MLYVALSPQSGGAAAESGRSVETRMCCHAAPARAALPTMIIVNLITLHVVGVSVKSVGARGGLSRGGCRSEAVG